MVSPAKPQLDKILQYSDQFDYPLTLDEIWFWQITTKFSKFKIKKFISNFKFQISNSYYHLPGRSQLAMLRKNRELASSAKWPIAHSVAKSLSRLPTIEAIFVTGALAMNNSPKDDDIDFMLVTKPHTLWLTRFLVFYLLHFRLHIRRPTNLPEHSSPRVSNTICDNLYLDSSHLFVNPKSLIQNQELYIAHEILQAKCIFDRSNIHHHFLVANQWAGDYLPVAYRETLKKLNRLKTKNWKLFGVLNLEFGILLAPINLLAFLIQFLHMRPKISIERISLHSAFFHPHQTS